MPAAIMVIIWSISAELNQNDPSTFTSRMRTSQLVLLHLAVGTADDHRALARFDGGQHGVGSVAVSASQAVVHEIYAEAARSVLDPTESDRHRGG